MSGNTVVVDQTRGHWSKYWSQGHLTSLPYGFTSNYDGEFLQFWNKQFALLEKGDCVLDVCSGNGSIALLAQDYSQRNKLDLTVSALDAADIDVSTVIEKNPHLAPHIQAIAFIPNTKLEELTIEPESVKLVSSQYGIEYTDWNSSARNIYSLLKPGGYFSLVCHSQNSKILNQMELQHKDYTRLCELDIFTSDILPEENPESRREFIFKLNHAIDNIHAMFKENRSSQVLANYGKQLDDILKLSVKQFPVGLRNFINFRQGVINSYEVSTDLLAVNHRLRESPCWYEVFVKEGMHLIGLGDIHYHTGEIAGKFYQFRKPE